MSGSYLPMFHPQGPTFWELARQALSSTERGYDRLAPKFDYTPFRTPDEILTAVAPHVGELYGIDLALDVCCGTGAAMRMLRPRCRERVVGIDMSQGMLDVARQRTADAPGAAELEFVRGNVLEMNFSHEFDAAVCFGAFGHILPRDDPRFLSNIFHALKPGGRFLFVTAELPPLWSYRYWLCRAFNAAMRVRNWLISPPFIMYYLTFPLRRARALLDEIGFTVEVREGVFPPPYAQYKLVIATRK